METPYRIILGRHGQTDFNLDGKIQDPDTPRLTEKGREQASKLKLQLESLAIKPDLIISSDATRNIETLGILIPDYNNMDTVKVDKRLQERYHRDLVGKTKDEIETLLGIKFVDRLSWELYFEGTDLSQLTGKFPNDETIDEVNKRVVSLVGDLPSSGTIMLLGSSIINQYLIEYLIFNSVGVKKPLTPEESQIDFQENHEIRILELDSGKKVLKYSPILF